MESDFLYSPLDWHPKSHGNRALAFDAFISHAGGDRSVDFVECLRSYGIKVWHDSSQEMGDARWRTRLVNALLRSRYVILFIDSERDILGREWVALEWQSALEAEQLSGVPRLVVAKSTDDARMPPPLSSHPQYIIEREMSDLAQLVLTGNVLPPTIVSKNELPSLLKAQESLLTVKPVEGENTFRILLNLIKSALAEVQSDSSRPAHALYLLWCLSHHTEALKELELVSFEPIVGGLEALASIGHAEGRAQSCFMLKALAVRGCVAAGAALLSILRREEDSTVLCLLLEWYLANGEIFPPLAREDYARALFILPTYRHALVDKAMRLATVPESDLARLRHFVFRVTHTYFEKLSPKAKLNEAERRFNLLLGGEAAATDWEMFFRELAADASLEVKLIDLSSEFPDESVESFLMFVERFSEERIRQPSTEVWHIYYEKSVLQPLAIAFSLPQYRERADQSYRKFLKALEAPVLKDMEVLERLSGDPRLREDLECGLLLRDAMKLRLTIIEQFAPGPQMESREGGLIWVSLPLPTVSLFGALRDLEDRRLFVELPGDLAVIWERWQGVPLA